MCKRISNGTRYAGSVSVVRSVDGFEQWDQRRDIEKRTSNGTACRNNPSISRDTTAWNSAIGRNFLLAPDARLARAASGTGILGS